jgi:hypothetical protein
MDNEAKREMLMTGLKCTFGLVLFIVIILVAYFTIPLIVEWRKEGFSSVVQKLKLRLGLFRMSRLSF